MSAGNWSCSGSSNGGVRGVSKRNSDENVFVKCPYYKCETQCVVFCEGVEENCCIHLAFATKPQRKEYERIYCQKDWTECMIAQGHNKRWGYNP